GGRSASWASSRRRRPRCWSAPASDGPDARRGRRLSPGRAAGYGRRTMHLPPFLYDATIPALEHHRRTLDWCREMRADHPVAYDEDHGLWMVFRYEEGVRVRRDYATFSSAEM